MKIDDVYYNFWGKPKQVFTDMELALMEGGHSLEVEEKFTFLKTIESIHVGKHTVWQHKKGDKLHHGALGSVTVEKTEGNSVHVRTDSDKRVYKVSATSLKKDTK